ncbi:hypothetical protein EMIHUDRAFT_420223 [Emiliania huxleyi CCMP1516]|uniref:Uncharacterized protein n=3 Tax=Emiliania huxleyi TaxID=2903 RepID=A0A0D3L0E2_EMIH1|nr:hypothetical protein EMIHUDRAFT_431669 [Emiliania huxleyi CCMP1516]XP_005794086.1 hypothetical protein EMIHUDRAFT_420223 [Emiliania huxleyi CCMP1516]EOD41477.1 hypothetical protein EMIHUDRAFT_431669 [Emiliania huxleyi CCMP1516]EOD41657.1 hypothetical protein EMIHUDRAFT_420223 [Emiliania huxleyi CCMP1516]|eukprot:XP_005793906.1 hypothetical protein EMIHUDRAFT_431669 [Emiliania huxleyi CCMP1516]
MPLPLLPKIITYTFATAHAATGLAALLGEVDLLQGVLLDTAKFKALSPLTDESLAAFLRGPKANGRGTAPNVRAWGARQFAVGAVFGFAAISGEVAAYQAALVALLARCGGDVLQNLLDGCMWKVALFLGVEGVAGALMYVSAN